MSAHNPFNVTNDLGTVKNFHSDRAEGSDFWFFKPSEKLYSPLKTFQYRTIVAILSLFVIAILSRAFWLQVVHGENYNLIAEENRVRTRLERADRGIIYDRFGNPLVMNVPHYSVFFTPADLPDSEIEQVKLAAEIAPIIGKDETQVIDIFRESDQNSYNYILLADNLSQTEAVTFASREDDLPAVFLSVEPERDYLSSPGLSHILGYVGKINGDELENLKSEDYTIYDYLGKNGLEAEYESILRGTHGFQEIEVDATGRPKKVIHEVPPEIGNGLITTLNLDLQNKLAESLEAAIDDSPTAEGGVAIAIEPSSGEILAMVSLPDYDNNLFSAGISKDAYQKYLRDPLKPLFHRAVSGSYPPGSTFKPIVALAALEEGVIDKYKTFLSTGGLQIGSWFFPDWKAGGHGRINIISAIANSVNTFFYYVGGGYSDFEGLGLERIVEYASKFHLGEPLGVDLPGEAFGFLPTREWKEEVKGEPWYIGDTYHLAIGQGDILVTPLQVAAYTAAIANGGTFYQPHLAKEFKFNSNEKQIKELEKKDYILDKQIASPENIEIVREGMHQTVMSGSAASLSYLIDVTSAGKTGTAQVGGDKENHAWFTGFAPFELPKITITIMVEYGGEGSQIAVPVFRDVVNWYFSEDEE